MTSKKFNSKGKSRFAAKGPASVGKILKTVWSPEEGHLRWSPSRGQYIDNDQALLEEKNWEKQFQNYQSSSKPKNEGNRSSVSSLESPRPGKQPSSHPSLSRFLEMLRNQQNGTDSQD